MCHSLLCSPVPGNTRRCVAALALRSWFAVELLTSPDLAARLMDAGSESGAAACKCVMRGWGGVGREGGKRGEEERGGEAAWAEGEAGEEGATGEEGAGEKMEQGSRTGGGSKGEGGAGEQGAAEKME